MKKNVFTKSIQFLIITLIVLAVFVPKAHSQKAMAAAVIVWINKNELGYKEVPFMYTEKIDRVKKVKSFLKAKFLKKKYNGSF